MTPPLPVARMLHDLQELGVRDGDVVMVHASLRRLGPVEGGAKGVIAALDRAVGREGTVLMVLGAHDEHAWVNDRPEEERERLLAGAEPFDHLRTPADPEVGVLAEVFRREPGTVVNDHPEGRFGARGRLAAALLVDGPWDDYYGPGSPLERLVDLGGKVLRLGADRGTVTLLHYAEYLADVPDKWSVLRYRMVSRGGKAELTRVRSLDDSAGIAPYAGGDYFADLLSDYLAAGRARVGTVGRAASEMLDARDVVTFGKMWIEEHLRIPA